MQLINIGILCVFVGIVLIMAGAVLNSKDSKIQWGVGGFVGPIPFGFGNNKNMVYAAAAISVILFVAFLLNSRILGS